MSKKIRFLWIDDDSDRKLSSDSLKASRKYAGSFIDVTNKSYEKELKKSIRNSKPDIILVDHNLEDISTGVFKKGSTLAAFIKETLPECPIVCITAEEIDKVDSQKKALYEDIFSITKISRHYDTIDSIAKSFRKLKENRPKNVDELLELMKAPADDHEKIKTIIPQELKENFKDKSQLINICHWLRETFLKRPGFVYDRLWLATLIGLKENSFEVVREEFSKARYSGIFADDSNELWWKSTALDLLAKKVNESGLPWEKGRKLAGVSKKDYSVCYSSSEEFPETVAFVDETKKSKRAPMKIKYTEPHPGFEELLFFEEIRVMA